MNDQCRRFRRRTILRWKRILLNTKVAHETLKNSFLCRQSKTRQWMENNVRSIETSTSHDLRKNEIFIYFYKFFFFHIYRSLSTVGFFSGHHSRCRYLDDLDAIEHQPYWKYTVHLTLSLQFSFELILLLVPEALPVLEHLNVTIEQPQKKGIMKSNKSTTSIHLCKDDLRRTNASGTKLRSLVLRHIELDDLLTVFDLFTFPLLETLTLVNVYGTCKYVEWYSIRKILSFSLDIRRTVHITERIRNCRQIYFFSENFLVV